MLTELVIFTGQPTKEADDTNVYVYDLHTSSPVATFKQSATSQNGLAINSERVFVAQYDKAIINVYRWKSEAASQRWIVPEKLRCIAVTDTWLVGGTQSGRLYLWEIASGNLIFAKEAHYSSVSSIEFSWNESQVLTGGEDAVAMVWNLTDLIRTDCGSEEIQPVHTHRQHSKRIACVAWGLGHRNYTASSDGTVCIRQRDDLLTTLLFPSPLTAMAVDQCERAVYVGCEDGLIACADLYSGDPVRAVGGEGSVISSGREESNSFKGNKSPVVHLCLNYDASLLVSATMDGRIMVWDVPSRQILRTVKQINPSIISLKLLMKPDGLLERKAQVQEQLPSLKRIQTLASDMDHHEIWLKLEDAGEVGYCGLDIDDIDLAQQAFQRSDAPQSGPPLSTSTRDLEEELKRMHVMYAELRDTYDALWKESQKLRGK